MSVFLSMEAQRMLAESALQSTSKSSSARKQKSSASSTPATTPPLQPQKHAPLVPPTSGLKNSPRVLHPDVKRPTLSRPESFHSHTHSHSRSPSASSSDSDDDFVYIFGSVKTTEEAVERIRAVQQPNERPRQTFLSGLPGSATNLADMVNGAAENKAAQQSYRRKMKGGLPATMEEFYECPRYTVSLTAAREAVFSDALSGFHSYVEREKEQREKLRELQRQSHSSIHNQQQHHHHHHHSAHAQSSRAEKTGVRGGAKEADSSSTLPSFSSGVTEERNAALAVTATAASLSATSHLEPPSSPSISFAAADAKNSSASPSASMKSSGSPSSSYPLSTNDVITAAGRDSGEGGGGGSQPLSASYMFIMRSRDTEAMSPVSPLRASLQGPNFGKLSSREDSNAVASKTQALKDPAPPAPEQHVDPNSATAPAIAGGEAAAAEEASPSSKSTSSASPVSDPAQAAKLEEMQLQTLLQERIYQRARVPIVFRCRYALEFSETLEEQKQRVQMRDRVLRHSERLAGPEGMTHAMRQEIRDRYADPNTIALEWPYVWDQFERDVPRETLFIDDTPYHNAEDALAAIMSYVEYCYDKGRQNIKERMEKLLAVADNEESAEGNAAKSGTTAAAATVTATQDGAAPSTSPLAPPKTKNFLESFLSASSAAIKGAVATVRASLPDFVGDPLLSVSGLDPALYHASLLFSTDPKTRSMTIFTAVREVVLASQQSFMGFPYQLLCEQVGTERLGLALEALEMNDDDDDDNDNDKGEKTPRHAATGAAGGVAQSTRQQQPEEAASLPSPAASANASAPIPIHRADDEDLGMRRDASTASFRSSLPNSRVVRIYQSSPPTLLTDNREGWRRRAHPPHVVDEWNVSPSSSSHASDIPCSPFSPETSTAVAAADLTKSDSATSAAKEKAEGKVEKVAHANDAGDAAHSTPVTEKDTAGEKPQREAARSSPLHGLLTDQQHVTDAKEAGQPPAVQPTKAQRAGASLKDAEVCRRRRERRRRRRSQLPLLVGEPRPLEFSVFLDIVRARVAAKMDKEEKKLRERERRERVLRMVERQREQWRSAPGSHCASSTSLDAMTKTHGDVASLAAPAKAKTLFREDVEGSAYLLPTQPAAAEMDSTPVPTSSLSTSLGRPLTPPETRGMRVRLFFDEKRNVPVVVVNKLFRLFTIPGVRGLTSSSSSENEEEEEEAGGKLDEREVAALNSRNIAVSGQNAMQDSVQTCKSSEKSLLLLIQVQFSLFTKEDAEVRWKWWKV
ncbi:hypothetical protein N2W54_006935 [Lotmaria passim]